MKYRTKISFFSQKSMLFGKSNKIFKDSFFGNLKNNRKEGTKFKTCTLAKNTNKYLKIQIFSERDEYLCNFPNSVELLNKIWKNKYFSVWDFFFADMNILWNFPNIFEIFNSWKHKDVWISEICFETWTFLVILNIFWICEQKLYIWFGFVENYGAETFWTLFYRTQPIFLIAEHFLKNVFEYFLFFGKNDGPWIVIIF